MNNFHESSQSAAPAPARFHHPAGRIIRGRLRQDSLGTELVTFLDYRDINPTCDFSSAIWDYIHKVGRQFLEVVHAGWTAGRQEVGDELEMVRMRQGQEGGDKVLC